MCEEWLVKFSPLPPQDLKWNDHEKKWASVTSLVGYHKTHKHRCIDSMTFGLMVIFIYSFINSLNRISFLFCYFPLDAVFLLEKGVLNATLICYFILLMSLVLLCKKTTGTCQAISKWIPMCQNPVTGNLPENSRIQFVTKNVHHLHYMSITPQICQISPKFLLINMINV